MSRTELLAGVVIAVFLVAIFLLTAPQDFESPFRSAPRPALQLATPVTTARRSAGRPGAPQNVGANGSGEHKAGAAELPVTRGEASPATESGVPSPAPAASSLSERHRAGMAASSSDESMPAPQPVLAALQATETAGTPLAAARMQTGAVGTALLGGWAGYADEMYGPNYLAVRLPRGTLVEICGVTCEVMRTNDYGPSAAIRPSRVADIAVVRWERICGLPRIRGLCLVTIETVDEIELPRTDADDRMRAEVLGDELYR